MNFENVITLFGIIGTIYTIYGFYKNSAYKIGYIEKKTFPLYVNDDLKENLNIFYNGKEVRFIQKITYRAFNNGSKALRKEDMYSNNMNIKSLKGEILHIDMHVHKPGANFRLERKNEKEYVILFDYFDKNQIVDVSILTDAPKILLECSAADMPKIIKYTATRPRMREFIFIPAVAWFCFTYLFSMLPREGKVLGDYFVIFYIILFLCAAILLFFYNIFQLLFKVPNKRIINQPYFDEEKEDGRMENS